MSNVSIVPIPEVSRFVLVKKSIVPVVVSNVSIVPIPVMFAFLAVNSSKTKSSVTYKSPPTYKSPEKVPTPTKVETPVTSKLPSTSKSVVEVTPKVLNPVTVREETIPTLRVVIPVALIFSTCMLSKETVSA